MHPVKGEAKNPAISLENIVVKMGAFNRKVPELASVTKGRHMLLLLHYFSNPPAPLSHVHTSVLVNI